MDTVAAGGGQGVRVLFLCCGLSCEYRKRNFPVGVMTTTYGDREAEVDSFIVKL